MPMKLIFAHLALSFCLLTKVNAHDPASDISVAAKRFLRSLNAKEKEKVHYRFKDHERENWHFFPGNFIQPNGRRGLSLKEMSPIQKILAHGLLGSALSHRGLIEATDVILLEQILFEKEGRDFRDPELFHVSIFGEPDASRLVGLAV